MLNSHVNYVVDQVLSPQECADIIEFGKTKGEKRNDIVIQEGNASVNKKLRDTEIYFFSEDSIYEKIMPHVQQLNQSTGWNYEYTRVEPLQLGIYKEGGHYDWHSDDSTEPYGPETGPFEGLYRKLSFSILLNDDFEGGEFVMVRDIATHDTREIPILALDKPGRMILFPSFMPHKVQPVTKGVRYSLVGWCCGPAWR